MYSRISLRQLSLAARVSVRSYTSSFREGSVAASKEFGYVLSMSVTLLLSILNKVNYCSKKEKAHEGMYFKIT
jgi:hypothetical protein